MKFVMVKMNEKSRTFLEINLPDLHLSQIEDYREILDPLYDLIDYKGFDEEYAYNAFGKEAQEVYDDIYSSNSTNE